MKRFTLLLMAIFIVFGLFGCSAPKMYTVEVDKSDMVLNDLKESYAPGETVTIMLPTITDYYYVVTANDIAAELDRDRSDLEYTYYTFTMPSQNVLVKIDHKSAWPDPVPPSGTCGENLTWELDFNTFTLTISGTGPMNDYDPTSGPAPWYDQYPAIHTVIIEDGVTSIGAAAFTECFDLTEVTIADSVTAIGMAAFADTGLTSIVIPDSVTTLGDSVFYNCTALTEVTLPAGITDVEGCVFERCTALTEVMIPAGVTNIHACAFFRCANLTTIMFSGNVQSISRYAFYCCDNLTTVNFIGTQAEWETLCMRNEWGVPDDVTVNYISDEN